MSVVVNFENQDVTDETFTTLDICENVTELNLSNNPSITSIPEGVFQNLSSLVKLELAKIDFEDSGITVSSFEGLGSLNVVSIIMSSVSLVWVIQFSFANISNAHTSLIHCIGNYSN